MLGKRPKLFIKPLSNSFLSPIKEITKDFSHIPIRLRVVFLGLFIFVSVILIKYSYVMLFSAPLDMGVKVAPPVERGEILDRNGKILALSTKVDSVTAWIPDVKDPFEVARTLSPILEIEEELLLEKLQGKNNFVYLARKVAPHLSERIRNIQREGRLRGITLEPDFARIYPEKDLASQTIGFVGIDNQGLSGIEYSLNNILSPSPSNFTNAFWLNTQKITGNKVQLTIDAELQYLLSKIAQHHFEMNQPDNLFIVVLKAKTAEILSMIQLPSFDLNHYKDSNPKTWNNLPVTLTYEPGSVFKVFNIGIFLNDGNLSPNEYFNDNGVYIKTFPNGQSIRIRSVESFGKVNAEDILRFSSNVGMAYASEKIDDEIFYQKLLDFGFASPINIPIAGEAHGILSHPNFWSGRSKPTISFGQEIGVSAMQMVQAATVLANGGLLVQPTLIKKIYSPEGEILFENDPQPKRRVLKESVAKQVLTMMQAVVERGSNWRNKIDGVNISSKTGTAEVALPEGGYSKDDFITSILSIFPTEDPEYILYIVFQHPKDSIWGGRIAAPFSRDVIEFLLQRDSLSETKGKEFLYFENKLPIWDIKTLNWNGETLPNLVGYSKRDLLPLFNGLANLNIPYRLEGIGQVYDFNYAPGTPLNEINELVIYLK